MPRPLSARRESGRGDGDALRAHGVKTRGCANDRLAPKLPHPESWRRSEREPRGNVPAERGRGLPSGKNLVFLYLCAPNSMRPARNRESCSAPRALRRRIGKKLGFLHLKRGFLHTGTAFLAIKRRKRPRRCKNVRFLPAGRRRYRGQGIRKGILRAARWEGASGTAPSRQHAFEAA